MASSLTSTSIGSTVILHETKENPILSPLNAFLSGKNPLSGGELIALLKQDPKLSELYSLFAGVNEGYSVEEHIHMVVDSFVKEFTVQPEVRSILERANLSQEQFMLFLALHDIGKGRAVQEIRSATPERKELELKYTQEEVRRACKEWNLEALIPVFDALLADDSIGDLMKTRLPTETDFQNTAQSIEAGARGSNLRKDDFLDLKILFHKVDAASYRFVRVHFFKCDLNEGVELGKESMPKYVGYSEANEAKAAQLKSALGISSQETASSSQEPKLTDGEFLFLFKESVWDYSAAEISNLEGALKYVRRTEGKESERYLQLKERVMQVRMARLPLRSYEMAKRGSSEINRNFFGYNFPSDKQTRKTAKSSLLAQTSSTPIEERLKLLSRLTFIHGSSSAALAMMLLSPEPSLLWTGALLSKGIAPMYGELGTGVDPWGVNQRGLSTETIRNIGRIRDYTRMQPFNLENFAVLQNPLRYLSFCNNHGFSTIISTLKRWKTEHPEEYAASLSPSSRRTELLIESMKIQIASLERTCENYRKRIEENPSTFSFINDDLQELQELIPHLKIAAAQLANGEELTFPTQAIDDYPYKTTLTKLREPYTFLLEEESWSMRAIQVTQLKQWDPRLFSEIVLPNRDEWLASLEKERMKKEKPLRELIGIIDHTFTEEQIAFINNQRNGSSSSSSSSSSSDQMPTSLLGVFASTSDIPKEYPFWINFGLDAVEREIGYYRQGGRSWSALIDTMLRSKILYGTNLDAYKPIFEKELMRIERGFNHIATALSDAPAVIEIPQDESIRSLITQPMPIIFSSSTIKPKPIAPSPKPSEYILDAPAKLGKDGCDILFTDTHESRERIKAVLPEHLRKEIEIHLFEELDVGSIPLIHGSHQIANL